MLTNPPTNPSPSPTTPKRTRSVSIQPITIGCFTLTETGMDVKGRPTWSEYQGVGEFITRAHKASGWWIADWVKYGETRPDWRSRLSQVMDSTGYEYGTIKKLKNLGESIRSERRRADVDISVHMEVARLHPREQEEWLARAAERGWSVRELRRHIRRARREKVIEGQAPMLHTVDVVVRLTIEAPNAWQAKEQAWAVMKEAIKTVPHAHVIAATPLYEDVSA